MTEISLKINWLSVVHYASMAWLVLLGILVVVAFVYEFIKNAEFRLGTFAIGFVIVTFLSLLVVSGVFK